MLAADSSVAKGPQALSLEQTALVRRHLAEVLASPCIRRKQAHTGLPSVDCDHALEGEVDSLRERMIGAECSAAR